MKLTIGSNPIVIKEKRNAFRSDRFDLKENISGMLASNQPEALHLVP